ncbi:hypothetical protein ACIOWI_35310 [Streptomyces sp. NPDC087659]|uniref:hypothetical protein n=1 Tax=Streptomyces sp. NPDC087659 TaxID=3365801 RepID=UPI0038096B76
MDGKSIGVAALVGALAAFGQQVLSGAGKQLKKALGLATTKPALKPPTGSLNHLTPPWARPKNATGTQPPTGTGGAGGGPGGGGGFVPPGRKHPLTVTLMLGAGAGAGLFVASAVSESSAEAFVEVTVNGNDNGWNWTSFLGAGASGLTGAAAGTLAAGAGIHLAHLTKTSHTLTPTNTSGGGFPGNTHPDKPTSHGSGGHSAAGAGTGGTDTETGPSTGTGSPGKPATTTVTDSGTADGSASKTRDNTATRTEFPTPHVGTTGTTGRSTGAGVPAAGAPPTTAVVGSTEPHGMDVSARTGTGAVTETNGSEDEGRGLAAAAANPDVPYAPITGDAGGDSPTPAAPLAQPDTDLMTGEQTPADADPLHTTPPPTVAAEGSRTGAVRAMGMGVSDPATRVETAGNSGDSEPVRSDAADLVPERSGRDGAPVGAGGGLEQPQTVSATAGEARGSGRSAASGLLQEVTRQLNLAGYPVPGDLADQVALGYTEMNDAWKTQPTRRQADRIVHWIITRRFQPLPGGSADRSSQLLGRRRVSAAEVSLLRATSSMTGMAREPMVSGSEQAVGLSQKGGQVLDGQRIEGQVTAAGADRSTAFRARANADPGTHGASLSPVLGMAEGFPTAEFEEPAGESDVDWSLASEFPHTVSMYMDEGIWELAAPHPGMASEGAGRPGGDDPGDGVSLSSSVSEGFLVLTACDAGVVTQGDVASAVRSDVIHVVAVPASGDQLSAPAEESPVWLEDFGSGGAFVCAAEVVRDGVKADTPGGRVPHSLQEFVSRLAADPVVASLPLGAPIVLAVSYAAQGLSGLPRLVAERTGRKVWSFSGRLEVRPQGTGAARIVTQFRDPSWHEPTGSWVYSLPGELAGWDVGSITALDGREVSVDKIISYPIPGPDHRPTGSSSYDAAFQARRESDQLGQPMRTQFLQGSVAPGKTRLLPGTEQPVPWERFIRQGRHPYIVDVHGSARHVDLEAEGHGKIRVKGSGLGAYLKFHLSMLQLEKDIPIVLAGSNTGNTKEGGDETVAQLVADETGHIVFAPNSKTTSTLSVRTSSRAPGRWVKFVPSHSAIAARKAAAGRGLKVRDVPGDGDCFMNALIRVGLQDKQGNRPRKTSQLRAALADAMEDDLKHGRRLWATIDRQVKNYLLDDWSSRLDDRRAQYNAARVRARGLHDSDRQLIVAMLRKPGEWPAIAGEIAPIAAAHAFGVLIHVLDVTGHGATLRVLGLKTARDHIYLVRREGSLEGGHWMPAWPDTDRLLTAYGLPPARPDEQDQLKPLLPGVTVQQQARLIAGYRLLKPLGITSQCLAPFELLRIWDDFDPPQTFAPGIAPVMSRDLLGEKLATLHTAWTTGKDNASRREGREPTQRQDAVDPASLATSPKMPTSADVSQAAVSIEELLGRSPIAYHEGRPFAVWLPGSDTTLFEDPTTLARLNELAPSGTVLVFGDIEGGMTPAGGRRVTLEGLASLLIAAAPDHAPLLAMPGADRVAASLAELLEAPVIASRYGLHLDPARGTAVESKASGDEPGTGFRVFTMYGPEEPEDSPVLLDRVIPWSPADGRSRGFDLDPTASATGSAHHQESRTKETRYRQPLGARVQVNPAVRSVGVPRAGLPYVVDVIRQLRRMVADKGMTVPEADWDRLPRLLLHNYPYLVQGMMVTLGTVEALITLDPQDARTVPHPAGSYDRPSPSVGNSEEFPHGADVPEPHAGSEPSFRANETINASYATGAYVQSHSGPTSAVRGAITMSFGIGAGPVHVVRAFLGASAVINASHRSTYKLGDVEGGHVQVTRSDGEKLLSYRPDWSVRIRTDMKRRWDTIAHTRVETEGEERLLLYVPDHYLEDAPGDQIIATGIEGRERLLPPVYYASGLTSLPDLFDEITSLLAHQGLPLGPGSVTREELRQKLWNLDAHLDDATDHQRGYLIILHDGHGKPTATVTVRADRSTEASRVGATSNTSYLENVRTAIDGMGGTHTVFNSTMLSGGAEVGDTIGDAGVAGSVSLAYTTENSVSISSGRTGLNVMVPRDTGYTTANLMRFRLSADVAPRGKTDAAKTPHVFSNALVRVTEAAAFKYGLPVDKEALFDSGGTQNDAQSAKDNGTDVLPDAVISGTTGAPAPPGNQPVQGHSSKTPDDSVHSEPNGTSEYTAFALKKPACRTVAYRPDMLRGTGRRSGDPKHVDAPAYIAQGRGIGVGLVDIDEETVRILREAVIDRLKSLGFLPANMNVPLADDAHWYSHGSYTDSLLQNLQILNKYFSIRGFETYYDQIHQDGLVITLYVRRGFAGLDLDVDAVKITVRAKKSPGKDPEFTGSTDRIDVVNLWMGMGTFGHASSGVRKLSLSFRVKWLLSHLKGSVTGFDWIMRQVGVKESVEYFSNRPELFEAPHRTPHNTFDLWSDWELELEVQHSGLRGEMHKGIRNPKPFSVPKQKARVYTPSLTPAGQDEVSAGLPVETSNAGNGEKSVGKHEKKSTPARVLDHAVICFVDATGMHKAATAKLGELTGPQGNSDQELHALVNSNLLKPFMREIVNRQFSTQHLFEPGFFRDTFGMVSISGKLGEATFVGATSDKVVLGEIALRLATAKNMDVCSRGITWVQADVTAGGSTQSDGPGFVQGSADANRSWQINRSHGDSITGGSESILIKIAKAYVFATRLDATVRSRLEKHGMLTSAAYSSDIQEVEDCVLVFALSERDALHHYGLRDVSITSEQLIEVMNRWKNGEVRLGGDTLAAVLVRWFEDVKVIPEPLSATMVADRESLAKLLADLHRNGDVPIVDPVGREKFYRTFGFEVDNGQNAFKDFRLPEYLNVSGKSDQNPGSEGATLGQAAVDYLAYRGGRTTYDYVREKIEEVAPGLLAKKPKMWNEKGRMIGSVGGADEALQIQFSKGRVEAMMDETLSRHGFTFYLLDPGILFSRMIAINVKHTFNGPPVVLEFHDDTGLEVYGHGYAATAKGTSRDGSQSFTALRFGGGVESSTGNGGIRVGEGHHRGVARSETTVTEQTSYASETYRARFGVTLAVEAKVLRLAGRPFNNLLADWHRRLKSVRDWSMKAMLAGWYRDLKKTLAGWYGDLKTMLGNMYRSVRADGPDTVTTHAPIRSDTVTTYVPGRSDTATTYVPGRSDTATTYVPGRSDTATTYVPGRSDTGLTGATSSSDTDLSAVPGHVVLHIPRGLAEFRPVYGPSRARDLRPLPPLPGDAFVAGVMLDDALPAALKLMRKVFGPEADGARTHTSQTIRQLMGRAQQSNYVRQACAAPESYLLTSRLHVPGQPGRWAELYFKGDFFALHVLGPIKGAGAGRYSKHQSSTTVSHGSDRWRPSANTGIFGSGVMQENSPTTAADGRDLPPDTVLGAASTSRVTGSSVAQAVSANYRLEQHVKQRSDDELQLVRLDVGFSLMAKPYERNLLWQSKKSQGVVHSDWVTGHAYVHLFSSEIDEWRSRIELTGREPVRGDLGWLDLEHAPQLDLADLMRDASGDPGTTAFNAHQAIARRIRGQAPGTPGAVVLVLNTAALKAHTYTAALRWAVETIRADLELAGEHDSDAGQSAALLDCAAQLASASDLGNPGTDTVDMIIRKVNAARATLRKDPSLPPVVLPVVLSISALSHEHLVRDIAHELRAHVRLDVVDGDSGTDQRRWVAPSGHVFAFDPLERHTPGVDEVTAEDARVARLITDDQYRGVTELGFDSSELNAIYRTSWNGGISFAEALETELNRRLSRLHETDSRLPRLYGRALHLVVDEDEAEEIRNDAQSALDGLREFARDTDDISPARLRALLRRVEDLLGTGPALDTGSPAPAPGRGRIGSPVTDVVAPRLIASDSLGSAAQMSDAPSGSEYGPPPAGPDRAQIFAALTGGATTTAPLAHQVGQTVGDPPQQERDTGGYDSGGSGVVNASDEAVLGVGGQITAITTILNPQQSRGSAHQDGTPSGIGTALPRSLSAEADHETRNPRSGV